MVEHKVTKPSKRQGVTHAIREKLGFLDERAWKRFSARRLELIDTLDLSSKKASEQEVAIHNVAEALRIEFNYTLDYFDEFDKLVRAAIQSVRRNRKRSTKSNRSNTFRVKLAKPKDDGDNNNELNYYDGDSDEPEKVIGPNFISEITKLHSDSQDEINDYSKSKHLSDYDKSRLAITSVIQPRITNKEIKRLPSIETITKASTLNPQILVELKKSRQTLLNYIERSKTCSEAASSISTPNLEFLGKGIIITCVGYIFEKSFTLGNERSSEYLRDKLTQETYLANLYRELDPSIGEKFQFNDTIVVTTLHAILGACVKDFGFETIMIHLCELLYLSIVKEYPLIAQNSIPFKASDYLNDPSVTKTPQPSDPKNNLKSDSFIQLNSLAAIATDLREQEISASHLPISTTSLTISPAASRNSNHVMDNHQDDGSKKAVTIRFLSKVLNFTFPLNNSAIPKLDELLENVRSAFNLSRYNDSQVLGLRNLRYGFIIKSDFDLEKVFINEDSIELEVFTQQSHAVPIYEITSMVVPNQKSPNHLYHDEEKIILPPPIPQVGSRAGSEPIHPVPATSFKFLSNLEDSNSSGPPVPVLPKFQPLL